MSQNCHGAVETARNRAGALGTAMRRKPYTISLFRTARDRPGPLVASSNPAGVIKSLFYKGFRNTFRLRATNVQQRSLFVTQRASRRCPPRRRLAPRTRANSAARKALAEQAAAGDDPRTSREVSRKRGAANASTIDAITKDARAHQRPAQRCSAEGNARSTKRGATATQLNSGLPASARPTGTVTFLFSDIEGSTVRWERDREAMAAALARHDALMSAALEARGAYVFKTVGDAFCAALAHAREHRSDKRDNGWFQREVLPKLDRFPLSKIAKATEKREPPESVIRSSPTRAASVRQTNGARRFARMFFSPISSSRITARASKRETSPRCSAATSTPSSGRYYGNGSRSQQ